MQETIARKSLLGDIQLRLRESPCVALLGARQVGKTTLARQFAAMQSGPVHYLDLEERKTFTALQASPEAVLENLEGLVIVDEIQRLPFLFEVLRPICDAPGRKASFLLLGSASWELVRGVSETLAGRIQFVSVPGFSMADVGAARQEQLWFRGGFPLAFLADDEAAKGRWLESFFSTFVHRDIFELGNWAGGKPAPALLERFWRMLAHCHGQTWNAAALASSLNISQPSLARYRDLLAGAFMLRVLHPWHENLGKRLVKSPKVYFRDSGLLHHLLNLDNATALRLHPHCGASWEGFALEQTLIAHGGRDAWFYATHGGAELDLLLPRKGRLWGFEIKSADVPSTTKSMHTALKDLNLAHLYVIYPGEYRFRLTDKITALPLGEVASLTFH